MVHKHHAFADAVGVREFEVDDARLPREGCVLLRNIWAGLNYADIVVARGRGLDHDLAPMPPMPQELTEYEKLRGDGEDADFGLGCEALCEVPTPTCSLS